MDHGRTRWSLGRLRWLRALATVALGTTLFGCFSGGANYANEATTLSLGQLIGAWWNERSGSVLVLAEDGRLTVAGLPQAAAREHPILQPVGQHFTGRVIAEGQWSSTAYGDGFEQWVTLRLQTCAGKPLPPEVEFELRVESVENVPAITLYLGDGSGGHQYFGCEEICPAGARH